MKFEHLEDRRLLAVLSVGSGDGAVQVDVDGYGSFGNDQQGSATGGAQIDVNTFTESDLVFESGIAIGAGGNRLFLSDGEIDQSTPLSTVNVSISPDNSTANSSFLLSGLTGSLAALNGLNVELVQELSPITENTSQVGALLTQTYVMTNTNSTSMDFDLIRYMDVDISLLASQDGGGRIFLGSEEWIVATGNDFETDLSQEDIFVAISSEGGIEPSTGRFEVNVYPSTVRNTILPGGNLNDLVLGDSSDPDELIDQGTYDTTGALRSNYTLAPGATAAFNTYTLFAEGIPSDILTETGSIVNAPPKITNVTVSGSTSTHAPFSFDTVDGSGLQLQTVPVGGADRVAVQFSEHVVNVAAGSLTLTGLSTHVVPTLATTGGFSYDVGTHTATWTFSAPFDADQYLISLDDAVTDVGGNQLDGEWINPFSIFTTDSAVSEFPSGNGTAGGDFNFVFTILPGDGNLTNTVTGSDFLLWQRNIGGPGHTFTQADYTGDGFTNSADNAFYQANNGTNLRELVFADFDANGIVDGNDLAIWQANANTGTTHAEGDADLDGDVDGNDFFIHQRQLGLELDWVM